jgi:osmotically-inducible protein OsmY
VKIIRNKNLLTPAIAAVFALSAASTPALAGSPGQEKMDSGKQMASEMKQDVSDAWLDGKLETTLLFNQNLNSFAIDTEVKHGKAYLTGQVGSEIDIDLARELALSIDGIDEVQNDLKVAENAADSASESSDYQTGAQWRQSVSNATLVATVKTKLLLNEHTSGLDINVDATNGVVTLSGQVDSDEESELAEKIAANVDDTRKVNNRLTVESAS